MPLVFTDAKDGFNRVVFVNDSFLALTRFEREELLGQRFQALLAPSADPGPVTQIEAAFLDDTGSTLETRCQIKGGGAFWAAIFISPVRDHAGAIVQHFASFIDLTRHRREEDHLRLLLDELNHRTQNTLANVQAIAAQTLKGVADKQAVEAFRGRILALSKAHAMLGREDWRALDLRQLLGSILQPFGLNERPESRFKMVGREVRLPPKAALTLAMVFHELATNAVKHGALSNGEAGGVDIGWQVETGTGKERLNLQWREHDGPAVTPPDGEGFGCRLIAGGLARELNGEVFLDYAADGVVCRIVMPLAGPVG